MKAHTPTLCSIFVLITLVLLGGCRAPDQTRTTTRADQPAAPGTRIQPAAPGETVYILLNSTRERGLSNDERNLLRNAVETVFDEEGFDRDFEVRRYARGAAPAGEPVLILNVIEWRQAIPDQIECRLTATYQRDGLSTDLGGASGSESGLTTALGPTEVNEIFERAAANAMRQLYPKLTPYIAGERVTRTTETHPGDRSPGPGPQQRGRL